MSEHLVRKTVEDLPDVNLAKYQILLDNEHTRITTWAFAPGDQTGWHKHTFDYVTVQQSAGVLLLQGSDGSETHVDYEKGRTVSWTGQIEHNAINISDVEVRLLEIEYK